MIIDTSAWIEFLRGTGSRSDLVLCRAFRNGSPLWIPEVVYCEVLQGAGSVRHFMQLQIALDEIPPYVSREPFALARSAALLYARCLWRGITIRSANDCLIAACAIEAGEPLLHADRDFERIATIEPKLTFA